MQIKNFTNIFLVYIYEISGLETFLNYTRQCIFLLAGAGAEVVLLTNDNNLINKALVCGVNAYNRRVSVYLSSTFDLPYLSGYKTGVLSL